MLLPRFTILALAAAPAVAQPTIPWSSIDSGGGASSAAGFRLAGTIGQPDAGALAMGPFSITGGFWSGAPHACYPNCDASTSTPLLSPNDFLCFLNKYAAGDPYANCDQSTSAPTLTPNDFLCFLNAYASSCP